MDNREVKYEGDLKKGNYKLSKKIKDFSYEDIPHQVREHAKICLLDTLGAIIGGSLTKTADTANDFVKRVYPGNDCKVINKENRSNVVGATLANAFSANALDIDDGYRPAKAHPGASVVPAALAVSEWLDKSGTEFMESVILGYEIGLRSAMAWDDYYPIYHGSGSWGTVATSVVAAKLMGLDTEEIYNTLGTAEWRAPMQPMFRGIDYPSMSKDGIGWGSPTGVEAAIMASSGVTGSPSLFGYPEYDRHIESLGNEYIMMDLYCKPHACCRWTQPAIVGTQKLMENNSLDLESIEKIEVYTFEESARLISTPPTNADEAQYNIAFPIAAALIDGEVGPRQFTDEKFKDQGYVDLIGKIEAISDDRFSSKFPEVCESEVKVFSKDGGIFSSGPVKAIGDIDAPLTVEEKLNKFRWLAGHIKSDKEIDRIIDTVNKIEKLDSIKELLELI